MSEKAPQSLKNHGRLDPQFHVVTFFILIANLVFSIFHFVHHWHDSPFACAWFVLLSVIVFIPFFKLRTYPLKVQDRVIRLEERIRLQALAPPEWHPQIYRLTDDQVVELAKQALEHNLNRKQIKERIKEWRPDNWRV